MAGVTGALMVASGAGATVPADNLTVNPSFEADLNGWVSWQGTLARVGPVAAAPDGEFIVRVTRGTGTSYTINDATATVADTMAGDEYTGAAEVRAANAQSVGRPVVIVLRERTPTGEVVRQTVSTPVGLTTDFRRIEVTGQALGDGNRIDVRVSQGSAQTGDAFEADELVVVDSSLAQAPTDDGAGGGGTDVVAEPSTEDPGSTTTSGDNRIANPSFEAGLDGWSAWQATLGRVGPFSAPDGQYAARVTRASGSSYTLNDAAPTIASTVQGTAHAATARVRAANSASVGRPVTLILRERRSDGTVVAQRSSPTLTLTGAFQTLSVTATAAGTGNRIDLRISQSKAGAGDAFDVDLVTLTGAEGTTTAPPPPSGSLPAPELLPYDPQALFNQSVAGRGLHPRSAGIAANMAQNARTVKINVSFDGEVPPVHVAGPTDPFYSVSVGGRTQRVRVPPGAKPGTGADHPLIVLNPDHPDHGRFVELRVWQASIDHSRRTISGSSSGFFHYNNDGAILNPNGTRSVSVAFSGNGTGSGLSYLAGLLRPSDIGSGRIRHAIRIAIGCNDFTSSFVAPAIRTDQSATRCSGASTPSDRKVDMGMRLRLPAGLDCNQRVAPVIPGRTESTRETQFLRILCRGIQEYGLIVLDGTGTDGTIIYLEDQATADWTSVAGQPLYGSYGYIVRDSTTPSDGLARSALHGIPWGSLQTVN